MELFTFAKETGKQVTHFGSHFTLTKMLAINEDAQVSCMHLAPGDVIGFHEAACDQLLIVVQGVGRVRGDQGTTHDIRAGEAAFWQTGEGHETTTDEGLTAIVIEAKTLQPQKWLQQIQKVEG